MNPITGYEDKQAGLGERLLEELTDCYQRFEAHPEYYSIASNNYRKLVLVHFPFIIAFEVLKNRVYVYSIPAETLKKS